MLGAAGAGAVLMVSPSQQQQQQCRGKTQEGVGGGEAGGAFEFAPRARRSSCQTCWREKR